MTTMFDLAKRAQFYTIGDLRELIELVADDTPVVICGEPRCFYHEEQDGSTVCLDCEDLQESYEEGNV